MPEREAVIGVIPARYGSTRFPGKPLVSIGGKPMIQHVYERASRARRLSRVVVATDDSRIEETVLGFGGRAVITSGEHPTGTDRVAEVAGKIVAPCYVNIQGDEPLIDPDHIDRCAELLAGGAAMSTLVTRIRWRHELFDQHAAKVVLDREGKAVFFSRSPIPFPRKYLDKGLDVDLDSTRYFKHIGIYGYTAATLARLAAAGPCELEQMESLEQLRAIVLGIAVKAYIVDSVSPCVDVPDDVRKIEELMGTKGAS